MILLAPPFAFKKILYRSFLFCFFFFISCFNFNELHDLMLLKVVCDLWN